MIYRTVLFRLNQQADKPALEKIQEFVSRIRKEIAEVKLYHFTPNLTYDGNGFNWILIAIFEDEVAMNNYRTNLLHLEFV